MRPWVFPIVTTTPTGGRKSGEIPIAAPDCERSTTRGEEVMDDPRQIKDLPVGQPGQLRRGLVPLSQRCRDGHRKSLFPGRADLFLEPAEVIFRAG